MPPPVQGVVSNRLVLYPGTFGAGAHPFAPDDLKAIAHRAEKYRHKMPIGVGLDHGDGSTAEELRGPRIGEVSSLAFGMVEIPDAVTGQSKQVEGLLATADVFDPETADQISQAGWQGWSPVILPLPSSHWVAPEDRGQPAIYGLKLLGMDHGAVENVPLYEHFQRLVSDSGDQSILLHESFCRPLGQPVTSSEESMTTTTAPAPDPILLAEIGKKDEEIGSLKARIAEVESAQAAQTLTSTSLEVRDRLRSVLQAKKLGPEAEAILLHEGFVSEVARLEVERRRDKTKPILLHEGATGTLLDGIEALVRLIPNNPALSDTEERTTGAKAAEVADGTDEVAVLLSENPTLAKLAESAGLKKETLAGLLAQQKEGTHGVSYSRS